MTHDLKTWEKHFNLIWKGEKTFEVRKNDRNYKVGDTLNLMEYLDKESKIKGYDVFTSRYILCLVTSILDGGDFGIEPGYVVMSIVVTQKETQF